MRFIPKAIQSFLLFVAFLSATLCFGQEKKSKLSVKQPVDADYYLQMAESRYEKDPKTALYHIEKALQEALREKNILVEARAYQLLAKININQKLYEQAIVDAGKSINLFSTAGNESQKWESYKLLALAQEKAGKLKEAENSYKMLLEMAEKKKNADHTVIARSGLGRVSGEKGDYKKAQDEFEKVLDLEESRSNTSGQIMANKSIGEVLEKQNKNSEAIEFYSKSEKLARSADDTKNIVSASENIKEVYRKEGRVADELSLRLNSLHGYLNEENLAAATEEYNQIATIYLKQQDPNKALSYLDKGLLLSQKINDADKISTIFQHMSSAYRMKNDYLKALQYFENYISITDSIRKNIEAKQEGQVKLNQELSLRQKKIEFLEKDLELNHNTLALLQNERKLQQLIIYSLAAVLLVFGFAAFTIYRISRKRRRANLLLALRSLRTQMNPHFIFNALNSVNSFIAKSDEKSANKYLSDFSRLMREVMENSQHDFIPLSTEIKILELYMALEHARFEDKFSYELYIDPALDKDLVFLPPMLVQPYVENAVWHGLRYKENSGLLKVAFCKIDEKLVITVEDNGIGRKRSEELKTANQKARISTGLKNMANRIDLINQLHHTGMQVKVSDPEDAAQSGTIVCIEIPLSKIEEREGSYS